MKKLAMLTLAIALAIPMTAHAEEDRIAALEEKVAALEQRVAALEGTAPAEVSEAPEQEAVAAPAIDTGVEYKGCTLEYSDFGVFSDKDGNPCLLIYSNFFNGSGETKMYSNTFGIKVFQHGKQCKEGVALDDEAYNERFTELRSGADAIRVASCFKLTDMTEVIVNMNGFNGPVENAIEFTLTLE